MRNQVAQGWGCLPPLMHKSRVNSSLCLEESGYSQILIKVCGVLIYKWVEHVPDTQPKVGLPPLPIWAGTYRFSIPNPASRDTPTREL